MADFVQTTNTKSALRELSEDIPDIATFREIMKVLIEDNPLGCTPFTQGEEAQPAVGKNREHYTAKIIYQDDEAVTTGTISAKVEDIEAFEPAVTGILGDETLSGVMGGDPVHDVDNDNFYCQMKCHDANGEIYYITLTRKKVRISSYEDETIRTEIETWADSVAALA